MCSYCFVCQQYTPTSLQIPVTFCSLCTSAGLNDHIRDICFDNAVLRVEVNHGEWPTLSGNAAWGHCCVDAIDFQLAEDSGMEWGCYAWGPRQMLGALAHAVVHMVTFGCNDPVVPLDILELDIEVSLAAHSNIFTATQWSLPERVFGVVLTETHLGHHEGLVGAVSRAIQGAQVLPILITADLQLQSMLAAIQKGLQGAGDWEGVPVTFMDLQHLFHHKGTIRVWIASICREEDLGIEAGVSVRVLRGTGVDPQRWLQDLDTLATFLQKLEGKTEAGLVTTVCLIYG